MAGLKQESKQTGTRMRTEARMQEHRLTLRDNAELFYRSWEPDDASAQAVIFLHRGHEHSARLFEAIETMALENTWVFAWDARGHGQTRDELRSFQQLVDDLDEFINHISKSFQIPLNRISIVAQSFSAVAAAAWVHEQGAEISSLILLAPAFKINLFVPGAYELLGAAIKIFPEARVPSYVSGAILTRDPIQARLYDNDRSITRDISARVLLELRREAEKLIDRACSISAPTLLIIPEQDYIVTRREQMEFYSRLRSTKKQLITFKGMRHDVIHDIEKEKALWAVRDFALENFDAMSS